MTAASWRTDTRRIAVIDGETAAPWLRGPVVTRYATPRARLAALARRVARSQFVADVRHYAGGRRWDRAREIAGAFGVAWGFIFLIRGLYVAAVIVGVAR